MLFPFDYTETINGAVVWSVEARARLELDKGTAGDWMVAAIEVDGTIYSDNLACRFKEVDVDLPRNHPLYNRLLQHLLNSPELRREMDEAWNGHRAQARADKVEAY